MQTKYIENKAAAPVKIRAPIENKLNPRTKGYNMATKLAIITKE